MKPTVPMIDVTEIVLYVVPVLLLAGLLAIGVGLYGWLRESTPLGPQRSGWRWRGGYLAFSLEGSISLLVKLQAFIIVRNSAICIFTSSANAGAPLALFFSSRAESSLPEKLRLV